jgi:cyclohexyl-isocyanide hydratase
MSAPVFSAKADPASNGGIPMPTPTPDAPLRIGVVLYQGATLLDFIGPVQVFAFTPGAEFVLIAETDKPIVSNEGPAVVPGATFANAPPLDAILVPGGGQGMVDAIGNKAYLKFLADQGPKVKWVTSVCNGAILLAAAGLLGGYEAITHWAWLDSLRKFKTVIVPTCVYARYHRDRNRVTAGGVSSGIDAALFLVGLWFGDTAAKGSQLTNQYAPAPPYADGIPPVADPLVLAAARKGVAGLVALTNAAIDKLGC